MNLQSGCDGSTNTIFIPYSVWGLQGERDTPRSVQIPHLCKEKATPVPHTRLILRSVSYSTFYFF
jgi:hypothetical protein